jgi:1-acyl-sn-glycerol-3-phosphate acyltransferase
VNLRAVRRAVALGFTLAAIFFRYWATRVRGPLTLEQRAEWMQFAGRVASASLGIHYRVEGETPTNGIVVANHLSYLDIAIFSAVMRCFFVAKAEISQWPYFGEAARSGGTMFVDRSSLASAEEVAAEIGERLELPVPILFFPEGTSTDGSSVLRFHSRLFEPAIRAAAPVTAASIRYILADGAEERELCWFGDEAFLPHLWKALRTPDFIAEIRFGEPHVYTDRREAADRTREEVVAMRENNLVLSGFATPQ